MVSLKLSFTQTVNTHIWNTEEVTLFSEEKLKGAKTATFIVKFIGYMELYEQYRNSLCGDFGIRTKVQIIILEASLPFHQLKY